MAAKKYRALVNLTYPASAAGIAKAKAAKTMEELQAADIDWKEVTAGAVVDDIPSESIPWLVAQGRIEVFKEEKEG